MPKIYIDGTEYQVKDGINLLQAVLDQGLDLGYFCWHPAMGSVGACRLCAVKVFKDENDTRGKIQMACMTPAEEGTRISVTDPEAAEFRRYVIEWLMTNHPHDCPVCDEGGSCHLQDMTTMCGQVYRRFRFLKRTYRNQDLGPLVNHEHNRCIQCYRCVRFYRDLAGGEDLDVFASKNRLYFGRKEDGVLQSEFSGNLAEVCPTGVFTDKTYDRHYTRKWDLETAPSVCAHCSLGCNTIPGARYGMLRRVTARFNSAVNGYFLCDRGRFGYEFVNSESRLREPMVKNEHGLVKSIWNEAEGIAHDLIRDAKGLVAVGSPRASLESNYTLMNTFGAENFCTGLSSPEQEAARLALEILREGTAPTPSLAEVELADAVLILGADPTNEAPMLDFAIRQAMRKAPLDLARKLKIPDWDAVAVSNALQNARGILHIASSWPLKLESIAKSAIHGTPGELLDFAGGIGAAIGSGPEDGSPAADLLEAHRPLVVTSLSAGAQMLKAAANVAWSLNAQGKQCGLFIITPEADTMGVAMLGGMDVDQALARIESGEADTMIVVDNDLARRVDADCLQSALSKLKSLIVLDCVGTSLTDRADVVLPTTSYIESDGTFVNNECRAQRFYQVFVPPGQPRQEWRIIQDIAQRREWVHPEDVLRSLAQERPEFAPALEAAPPADWRDPTGLKVARFPHRYTGRTAKAANVDVREPMPPPDPATPFAFSMEGDQNPPPAPLVPRFWWPGWNSENSISKFQIEIGGPMHGGPVGVRLVEPSSARKQQYDISPVEPLGECEAWVIPQPRIFGSDELARLAEGLAQLAPEPCVTLNPTFAARLSIEEGSSGLELDGRTLDLPVRFDEKLPEGVLTMPAGFDQTMGILAPARSTVAGGKCKQP